MSATTEVISEKPVDTPIRKGESCILVIFGASGDLTRRKLMSALYNMSCGATATERFEVLGIGRTKMTDEAFRTAMREATMSSKDTRDFKEADWKDFSERLFYFEGDPTDEAMFPRLAARPEHEPTKASRLASAQSCRACAGLWQLQDSAALSFARQSFGKATGFAVGEPI